MNYFEGCQRLNIPLHQYIGCSFHYRTVYENLVHAYQGWTWESSPDEEPTDLGEGWKITTVGEVLDPLGRKAHPGDVLVGETPHGNVPESVSEGLKKYVTQPWD